MKNTTLLLSLILAVYAGNNILAQPKCFFEHYGVKEGLPQQSITGILQDQKGFIWISTWDGLSKYDGHKFHNYKIQLDESHHTKSNRIDHIAVDKYGYIWTLPYDKEVYRFDPKTETIKGLRSVEEYKDFTFLAKQIIPTSSGKVWLLSDKMGCVCISDSSFNVEVYNVERNLINSNEIHAMHEDKELNSWLMTSNGLYMVNSAGELSSYFTEKAYIDSKEAQDFFCAMETDTHIWFGSNKGKIWILDKSKKQFRLLETNSKSCIKKIKKIDDVQLLVCTADDGFFIVNKSTLTMKQFGTSTLQNMLSNTIFSCYIDKSSSIWLELDYMGAFRFDMVTETMTHYAVKIETPGTKIFPQNMFVFCDKEDRLWVHPRGGGFSLYDREKKSLIPFYNEPHSPSWRFSNILHMAFSDRQGNLWLGPRSYGLEKIIFNDDIFKSFTVDDNIHSILNNDIRCTFEDDENNIWISNKGEKLYVHDKAMTKLGYLCEDGTIGYGKPLIGTVYCMLKTKNNELLIGTKGQGIYKLQKKGSGLKFDIKHYKHSPKDLYSLSSNSIYSLCEDSNNRIWIGTYGGGLNLWDNTNENRFISYRNNLQNYPTRNGMQVRIVTLDKYNNICVGTTMGLIMFSPDFTTTNDIKYHFYTKDPNRKKGLTGIDVYDITTTKSGNTYLATFGGGINKIKEVNEQGFPTEFTSYTTQAGLASDITLSITEDEKGLLWIVSEGNLTKFDPIRESFENFSEVSRLINGQSFSEGSTLLTQSGNLLFGYSRGYILVDPEKVKSSKFEPYIAFTNLKISNKDVPIAEGSILDRHIDDIQKLKLNNKQNFISIEFAALDYSEPDKSIYAYKLEGFDEEWIVAKNQRVANYTNLSPGNYVFRVKSAHTEGVWMNNEHSLEIEITPSFWQTKWAAFLYILLFFFVVYIILRVIFIYYRMKDKVKLEQAETEIRTRFFIDISHEIRTPLTMIISPIQNIMDSEEISDRVKQQLVIVMKSANRMSRMVNQILDFRKIQKQKLEIQETLIGDYVEEICSNFTKAAEIQGVLLIVNNKAKEDKIWVDRDNVEKLVFNLLSNAFKFSNAGSTVEVSVFKKDNNIAIEVKDQGRGMTKEVQSKLFTRFSSFNTDKSKPSTGIGLSIVKEIANKHNAKILVDSEVNKGSCFTVFFPLDIKHFGEETYVVTNDAEKQENEIEKPEIEAVSKVEDNTSDNDQTSILLVEDDEDLRNFIRLMLSPHYRVLEATNGEEGYEIAVKESPNFILSDIMMPKVDGVELLQMIKENEQTSHIPFILLTAKTNLESQLEGMKYGADDYITKPFNVELLKTRINNILEQRKLLYKYYSTKGYIETADTTEELSMNILQVDKEFLETIIDMVEKNIDNSDFVVDDLASYMCVSRSVFYKKLKSLTGHSPIEFIRDIRMKYAARLLSTQQYTAKETAFMVGFSDMKYFNQWFKTIIGTTPGNYKKTAKKRINKI